MVGQARLRSIAAGVPGMHVGLSEGIFTLARVMVAPSQHRALAQSWAMEGSESGLHLQPKLQGLWVVGTSSYIHMLILASTQKARLLLSHRHRVVIPWLVQETLLLFSPD